MKTFRRLRKAPGRIIDLSGVKYLHFGGTSYLGLSTNQRYIDLYIEGIKRYGLNTGTSRSNNIQIDLYPEAEKEVAQRFGFKDAILTSSGYLAAQLCVQSLAGKGEVIYAPNAHPSLRSENTTLATPTNSFAEWATATVKQINTSSKQDFVIITNAIDNLRPELYDFAPLNGIQSGKKIYLIIDDSHGIGIIKENKCSIAQIFDKSKIEPIIVASLAKGLGTDAGIILGATELIDNLRYHPIYTAASPPSPGSIYALLHGQEIYLEEREKLQLNIKHFTQILNNDHLFIDLFPVITVDKASLDRFMYNSNIIISSFPYPNIKDKALNRIVISSSHRAPDLDTLAKKLNSFMLL